MKRANLLLAVTLVMASLAAGALPASAAKLLPILSGQTHTVELLCAIQHHHHRFYCQQH
jgi:hypothetical protein